MTFEERIELLTERHEALTQTVELILRMQRDNEERFQQRFQKNEERLAQLMDTMNRLGRIIEIHEHRLDEHGHSLEDLEGNHGEQD